jgi:glycosyltransferase involved in cell wall biosynthesis
VRFEIDQKSVADYRLAVDFLNMNRFDAVSLQHEYGIYGGRAGNHVLRLLHNLRVPVITTLHTVLEEPDRDQREVLAAIGELSDRVVVMSQRARSTLARVYGVPMERIAVIPHGVPDMPFLDTSYHKDKFGLVGKKVILTFGLLSRGKGIEYVIEALPEIVARHPDVVYLVAGQTHPGVRRHEGEAYRISLRQRADELGVGAHLMFRDEFLETGKLGELLSIADICVTPYLNREQIVSGVLSFALGAGKEIVSTPYWYAEEMLAEGRGRLAPFRDAGAVAREVVDLLGDDVARQTMRKQAYTFARDMIWSEVGAQYLQAFREVRAERALRPRSYRVRSLQANHAEPPAPSLGHLQVLTDDTGILQHARFAVPDRDHGYCTDDNARALIVALMARRELREAREPMALASRYMSFLQHAFNRETRRFRNFMGFDRHWQETVGSEDAHGRALWALGRAVLDTPSDGLGGAAMWLFERALPAVLDFASPRAWAFALVGIDAYLERFGGASDARRARVVLAERLHGRLKAGAGPEWPWLEDIVTYANGVIPQALIVSGSALDRADLTEAGLTSLRWLCRVQTDTRGHFTPIGNDGWLVRGGAQARFDQQPTELQHMVDAMLAAYAATGEGFWLDEARRCYEWFLGRNDLQQAIADPVTGGCRDGLSPDGVNLNQGAESTLAWLHASLSLRTALGVGAAERPVDGEGVRRPALKVVSASAERGVAAPH